MKYRTKYGEISWQPDHLENALVKLAPLKQSDFEVLYEIASDPLLWAMHPKKERYRREVFVPFFDHAIERGSAFLIIEKTGGKVIGSSGYYDFRPENKSIAIGYTFIARSYWGGPFNIAAKELLLNYAFLYVEKVFFYIGECNRRSQKAILKTGAVKTREFFSGEGAEQYHDCEYLLQKEQWQRNIFKNRTLQAHESAQVNTLWNEEYPEKLKDRFNLLVGDMIEPSHYLIKTNGQVTAWSAAFRRNGASWFSVIVSSAHKGKGLGSSLIKKIQSENKELYAWVIDHNSDKKMNGETYISPLSFYIRHGFEVLSNERIESPLISAVKIRWKRPEPLLGSNDDLTVLAGKYGITTWEELLEFVKKIPYGRNGNRSDPSLVLTENKGTCSSKHALVKSIADANSIPDVKLMMVLYRMNRNNTKGIGLLLEKSGLSYLPEAHCYIRVGEDKIDITSKDATLKKIENEIISEMEISPAQVNEFKIAYHQDFLRRWMTENQLRMTFEELWSIREKCIASLGTQHTNNS